MSVGSPFFVAFALLGMVIWYRLGWASAAIRLLAINTLFAATFFSAPSAAVPIATFVVAGYVAMRVAARVDRSWVLPITVPLLIALFAIVKRYTIVADVPMFPFDYATIGLSYLLFRILHLVIDIRQGAIREPLAPVDYFNYLFFFLTFVSGPIMRYPDYRARVADAPPEIDAGEIRAALARVVEGFIKVLVIAAVANRVAIGLPLNLSSAEPMTLGVFAALPAMLREAFVSPDTGEPLIRLAVRFMLRASAFLVYLYYNFAGYMDIVVGIGRLFGFRVAENFDRPFTAGNFLEFWSRWHITLADWFKTYLFNPVLKAMAERSGGRFINGLGVVAFFVTFLVMGVWHGTTAAFVVYGVFLGAGVSLNRLYQVMMQRYAGKERYGRLAAFAPYRLVSRAMMIAYFALSLSCLWLDAGELARLGRLFGALGLIKLFVAMTAATAVAVVAWDWAMRLAERRPAQSRTAGLTIGLVLLIVIWGDVNGAAGALISLIGVAVPDHLLAAAGAAPMMFAVAVAARDGTPAPVLGTGWLSFLVALLLVANLMYTGAVPDFVYKGF